MRTKQYICGTVVALLLLASCATSPTAGRVAAVSLPNPRQSYALFYTDLRAGTFAELDYAYRLVGTEKSEILLPMTGAFTEVDNLKEGNVLTYRIEIIDKKTGEKVDEYDDYEVFSLEDHSVSILTKKAIITLDKSESGEILQGIELRDLKDNEIERCVDYIKHQKKYAGLRIRTTR